MMNRWMASTACAAMLTLSACGGGGGGGGGSVISTPAPTPSPSPTPSPTPTPTATNYNTSEYSRSNQATSSKAISAWQAGATGAGVKVGVIDSGINASLSEFAGRIDSASGDMAGTRELADESGHGTAVAGTIAAARNNSGVMGVAFDATIVALRTDEPGTCASTDGCSFYDNAIAHALDTARLAGAKVVNLSMGGDPPGSQLMSAVRAAVNAGMLVVVSAGNDSGVNADAFGRTMAEAYGIGGADQRAGSVILAGALDSSLSSLASFSNQAGSAQAWYLAALGSGVSTYNKNGTLTSWSGTSFSAPIVSGAAVLLAQAFPNLTGTQIAQILFNSADDLGAAGDDPTYGQGRLNLQRAFQPQGNTSLAGTETAVPLSSSGGVLPEAAGDGAASSAALGAIVLDGFSRAYEIDFARTLMKAPVRQPLARALTGSVRTNGAAAGPVAITLSVADGTKQALVSDRLGIGPRDAEQARLVAGRALARLDSKTRIAMGFHEGAKSLERSLDGAAAGAFLVARDTSAEPGFAARRGLGIAARRDLGANTGVSFSGEQGKVDRALLPGEVESAYRLATVSVDRRIGGSTRLTLSGSALDEDRTVLGGEMQNWLGGGTGAHTLFADAEARRTLGGGWSATLAARRGWTRFDGGSFGTSAYAFDLAKAGVTGDRDRLGLRVSQPLRVDRGGFAMWLPTGYDYASESTTFGTVRRSFAPSGRELDAELSYAVSFDNGWLGTNLYARRQPGHIAGADADVGAAIRYSLGF